MGSNTELPSEIIQAAADMITEYHQSTNASSVDTSVHLYQYAVTSCHPNHPQRPPILFELSRALLMRFFFAGQVYDLREAIRLLKEAIDLQPPPDSERFRYLLSLSQALHIEFNQTFKPQLLLESATKYQEALGEDNEAQHMFASATDMMETFEQCGIIVNLDEPISLLRTSLFLRTYRHPRRSRSLNNLASALWTRFEQKGDIADLEESIYFHRQALNLRPSPHPLRSESLNNLASALSTRFEQKGDIADLEESIYFHRQALNLRPSPHPLRSESLNNLASALSTRFEQKGDIADLEESIVFHRQALDLIPSPHPLRSMSLNNLASALSRRFQQKGDITNLEESIVFHRQALDLISSPHPLRSMSLHNL